MLNVDSRLRSLCYRIYLNFVSLFKTFHLGLRVMICFPMAKIDRRCECTQAILNFKIHQCQCKIVYSNPWILTLYPDRFPTEQEKVTSLFSRTDWLADILVIWGARPKQTGKKRKIIWNFIAWSIVGLMSIGWMYQIWWIFGKAPKDPPFHPKNHPIWLLHCSLFSVLSTKLLVVAETGPMGSML